VADRAAAHYPVKIRSKGRIVTMPGTDFAVTYEKSQATPLLS
jgi:hypothetical protein